MRNLFFVVALLCTSDALGASSDAVRSSPLTELVSSDRCIFDNQDASMSSERESFEPLDDVGFASFTADGILTCCRNYIGGCLPFTPHITCRTTADCGTNEFCDTTLAPPTCLRRSLHGTCVDGTQCASGSCNLVTGLCEWPQPAGDQSCLPGSTISGCPVGWVCDPNTAFCSRRPSIGDSCSIKPGTPVTRQCDRDTHCIRDFFHPGEWYCEWRVREGEQCNPTLPQGYECEPGTACTVRQRCEQPADTGDCFNNDACQSGVCRWPAGARRGKCDPPASSTGGPCRSFHDCPHGDVCSNGICRS